MKQKQRALLAMVNAIRADLARRQRPDDRATRLPADAWDDLVQITRRIERAERKGWHLAAAQLAGDQTFLATCVQSELATWMECRRSRPVSRPLPNASDLFRDLAALQEEFGEVKYEGGQELWVTTEPIELEGIRLGRFQIRLNWLAIGASTPYRVVALDPNPAASDDNTTHPHVRHEHLCEGGGRTAIEQALRDWRLYDFFLIVNRILLTYSLGSAHVELADWHGAACRSCDCSVDEDSRYDCHGCNCTLCADCTNFCGCGYDFCSDCISNCPRCDENCCQSCLSICAKCKAAVCSGCRETETLCKKCHERETADAEKAAALAKRPPKRKTRRARAAV
ncbi:MAG TPA: hypothetical protein VGY55_00500 [Pirellulales bacterium]|jgi:hypothetical protein|nr:hypothetical protein [Pirellulales bacterium]